jgi:hypothetical protein
VIEISAVQVSLAKSITGALKKLDRRRVFPIASCFDRFTTLFRFFDIALTFNHEISPLVRHGSARFPVGQISLEHLNLSDQYFAIECSSSIDGGFCFAIGGATFRHISMSGSLASSVLLSASFAGSLKTFESSNVTANRVADWAAGLYVSNAQLLLRFCVAADNGGSGHCIVLGRIGDHIIECVTLRNNSCEGLIAVATQLTMRNCSIRAGLVKWIVGTDCQATGGVHFIGCNFDIESVTTADEVTCRTSECRFGVEEQAIDPSRCPWAAPGTRSVEGQQTRLSIGAIAAIVGGCVALAICISVGIWIAKRRPNDAEDSTLDLRLDRSIRSA